MKKFFKRLYELNWLNYLIELIIVFLGITIAFYFNQRAETKKIAELEKTYLELIANELSADSLEHHQIIKYFTKNVEEIAKNRKLIQLDVDQINDSLYISINRLSGTTNYHPDFQTYHSIAQNGEILKISNLALRKEIAQYYAYYNTLEERHNKVNTARREKLFPFIANHYNLYEKKVLNKNAYRSDELLNILYEIRDLEIQRIYGYKKALEMSGNLKNLIVSELNKSS